MKNSKFVSCSPAYYSQNSPAGFLLPINSNIQTKIIFKTVLVCILMPC